MRGDNLMTLFVPGWLNFNMLFYANHYRGDVAIFRSVTVYITASAMKNATVSQTNDIRVWCCTDGLDGSRQPQPCDEYPNVLSDSLNYLIKERYCKSTAGDIAAKRY